MYRYSRNKYGNVKTEAYGIKFDSKKEADRYCDLRIAQNCGVIENLMRQVRFEVIPKTDKFRAVYYVADFVYRQDGRLVVEDVKGFKKNPVYILKKKLMYQVHGIEIREV